VPPPVPTPGEPDEFVAGTLGEYGVTAPLPVGLGFRVPLLLISPWTRGGWVTSEVTDHTSVILTLRNQGHAPATFGIKHHHYIAAAPHTVKVPARGTKTLTIDPLAVSHGWYDLTVTADNDHTWSQRLTGHLETGRASITG